MNTNNLREGVAIGAVITLIGLLGWALLTPTGQKQLASEQKEQEEISKAINTANEYREMVFCAEYIKIVPDVEDAPYGYKHCFDTKYRARVYGDIVCNARGDEMCEIINSNKLNKE